MHNNNITAVTPSRILYTMIRVVDLGRSIDFYTNTLGMTELRREDFTVGRFTLVFIGYGAETTNAVIELAYNWDQNNYQHGTRFGHVALGVTDVHTACNRLENMGVAIIRAPGPMMYAVDQTGHKEIIAFIEDPDGYKIELIETLPSTGNL